MRALLLLLSICLGVGAYAQTKSYSDDYRKVKEGFYYSKSRNFDFVGDTVMIPAQTTIGYLSEATRFLSVLTRPIWLFKNSNPQTENDVAGYLKQSSYIQLVNIDYRSIYQEKGGYNTISFEVWFTILIDGQTYYTDYRPHTIRFAYPFGKQLFFMTYQYTGYDYEYDTGYPNNFKVLVTMDGSDNMKIVYESKRLDFSNDDEFWDIEDGGLVVSVVNNSLNFELIGANQTLKGTWNGVSLVNLMSVIVPPGHKDYKKP